MQKVVVTGISGFLGSHLAIQLLQQGYAVRGTVRSKAKAERVRAVIEDYTSTDQLEIVKADLLESRDWAAVMRDVDFVHHVASPFPKTVPKDENDLIEPAVEGSLRVLRAALQAGVKKCIVTSSIAAVLYGKEGPYRRSVYDESTWTNPEVSEDITPYLKSKTLAEQAVWTFYESECCGQAMEVTTILPGAILGPVLESDYGTSASLVLKLLDGSLPMVPQIGLELVDVRDVADLHLRAMQSNLADGQRVLACSGYATVMDIADVLRLAYPDRKFPKRYLPNWLLRPLSWVDGSVKQVLVDVDAERRANSAKARNLLDWQPRSIKEAIITCADSLIDLGIVN